MNKTLKILEVSACGNRQAAKKLRFVGDMDNRILFMFQKIMQKGHYDIFSVRDIPWHSLCKLQRQLGMYGYRMYIHKSWNNVKEKWRYTCLSALFCLDTVEFNQMYTSDKFETVLRYVYGRISFDGEDIYYKTSHFPCVDDSKSHLSQQIERKVTMLKDENEFQRLMNDSYAISSGDFNGAQGEDYYGQEQFDIFEFVDTVLGDTYENKTLDHCFISKALRDSRIKVSAEVIDDYYMLLSDHKIILITLEAA